MDLTDTAVQTFVWIVWPVHITANLPFEPSPDLKDSERDTLQWLSSNQGTDVPDKQAPAEPVLCLDLCT